MRNYEKLLEAGNKAELEKLIENEHKGGWNHYSITDLVTKVMEEVKELRTEFNYSFFDARSVRRECADIRAYIDMIIEKCDELIYDSA